MAGAVATPTQTYIRRLLATNKVRPAYGQGLRGAFLWALGLGIGILVNDIAFWFQVGFVGWLVSYTDDYLAVGRRVAGGAVVTVVGAVVTFLATLAGNNIWWSVAAAAGIGFGVGLFGVVGPAGVKKSLVLMFLTLFSIGFPGDVADALGLFYATLIGGAAAILLMLITLPWDRNRNQTLILVREFEAIADFADTMARDSDADAIGAAHTEVMKSADDASVDARWAVLWRGSRRFNALYQQGMEVMKALSAFIDVRSLTDRPSIPGASRMYDEVAAVLRDKAVQLREAGRILTAEEAESPDVAAALGAIAEVQDWIRANPAPVAQGDAALRSLSDAVRALGAGASDTGTVARPSRPGVEPWHLVVINLSNDTWLRRHLLRYVVLIAVATWLYKFFDIPDGFFMLLGVNIMLQPDLGTGFSRLQIFSLGTILGSIIGAFVGVTFGGVPVVILLVSAAAFYWLTAYFNVTYWSFAIGISIAIVSALGLLIPGGWDLGLWRIADTLLAAVIVFLGLILLWPTRGRRLVPKEYAALLRRTAKELQAVIDGESWDEFRARRERILVANTDLAFNIERTAREPGAPIELKREHQRMLVDVRSIQGGIANLAIDHLQSGRMLDENSRNLAARVVQQLELVATAYETGQRPEQLDRIVPPGTDTAAEYDDDQVAIVELGVATQYLLRWVRPGAPSPA
ncbi:MAG: FUSC family protein [Actinobacteria bacterium]|nr:FUSC family protein [Actinomycetota bacterium]